MIKRKISNIKNEIKEDDFIQPDISDNIKPNRSTTEKTLDILAIITSISTLIAIFIPYNAQGSTIFSDYYNLFKIILL